MIQPESYRTKMISPDSYRDKAKRIDQDVEDYVLEHLVRKRDINGKFALNPSQRSALIQSENRGQRAA